MGFLRDSMVREMKIRNYSDATIKLYTKAVYDLAYFYGSSGIRVERLSRMELRVT